MSTPLPSKPFTPTVTTVPVLGPSSGNPAALKDPKSVASIGGNIQAMQDQANADQLYDVPAKEGFCVDSMEPSSVRISAILLFTTGVLCIMYSLR